MSSGGTISTAALWSLLQSVRERIAVIACELELGEVGVAYQVAGDLERELDAELRAAA